ncbi:MAG: glycoside hydrolase family 3 C-terminal domain-containing protein [Clostridia bacterium]|nr:glycoside hydrolase family 3 C-terminal domain-containing protein [Clostridia bacterium]
MAKRKIARKTAPFALLSVAVCAVLAVSGVGGSFAASADAAASSTANFTSDYSSREEVAQATIDLSEQIAAEGMVLVKNDGALPISVSRPRVSVFGSAAISPTVGASNESGDTSAGIANADADLFSSLADAGFSVNPATKEYFANAKALEAQTDWSGAITGYTETSLDEQGIIDDYLGSDADADKTSVDDYAEDWDAILKGTEYSYSAYSDAAIVMLSGKGTGTSRHSRDYDNAQKALVKYLETKFDTVILLINESYPYELDWAESDDNINAILIVGRPGNNGLSAVGKILDGEINPSGHLADLYAADFTVTPSYNNFDINADGGSTGMAYYLDESGNWIDQSRLYQYEEGIYVGYHYYETMATFESGVTVGSDSEIVDWTTGSGEDWYNAFVTYPFGYGLSYTTFEYSDFKVNRESFSSASNTITATVTVTNTGSVAGKDVVQLYYSAPWEADKGYVEKSAVNLGDFAKTNLLEPGESQKITISISAADMASYDYTLNNWKGGYILDAGDYTISLRSDSHDVLVDKDGNDCSAIVTLENKIDSGIQVDTSGNDVENQFASTTAAVTGTDLSQYDSSANDYSNSGLKFDSALSRETMATTTTTAPAKYDVTGITSISGNTLTIGSVGNVAGVKLTSQDLAELKTAMRVRTEEGDDDPLYDYWTDDNGTLAGNGYSNEGTLKAADMIGVAYGDSTWDDLLDELSIDDLVKLFEQGGYGTASVDSIALPHTFQMDGPFGWTGSSESWEGVTLGSDTFPLFCSEVMVACTFNKDLAAAEGDMIGEQGLWGTSTSNGSSNTWTGYYSPALNIHRSPFDSRGTEYYSEDPVLSGFMAASVASGAQAKGTFVTLKHFAVFNDGSMSLRSTRSFDAGYYTDANGDTQNYYTTTSTDSNGDAYDVSTYIYAGNSGISSWLTEQTLREIYLRGFEIAVKVGGATGVMSSFGKIGYTACAESYQLLTSVLRNEWGFKGIVVSDITFYPNQDGELMALAGNNLALKKYQTYTKTFFDDSITYNGNTRIDTRSDCAILDVLYEYANANNSATMNDAFEAYYAAYPKAAAALYNALREGAHGIIYAVVNSNAMQIPYSASVVYGGTTTAYAAVAGQSTVIDLGGATLSTFATSYASYYSADPTYAITSGAIPAGMTFDATTGQLSGTPTAAGTYTFDVTASCAGFESTTQSFTVVVAAAASSTSSSTTDGTDTASLQAQITDLQSQIEALQNSNGTVTETTSSSNGLAIAGLVIGCVAVVAAVAAVVLILLRKKS